MSEEELLKYMHFTDDNVVFDKSFYQNIMLPCFKNTITYKKIVELLQKEKQDLIDYLKDLVENRYTNGKVVWFDSEFARDFGELCTMAGAGDTRLALVPLSEIENILSKIEKR